VIGLARYSAVRSDLLGDLIAADTGLLQLPCPEASYLGMNRWGMTYEQYDTPSYRRHCRSILEPVLDTVDALHDGGCTLSGVWGVDGSPSCGVNHTCTGYCGGEIHLLADKSIPDARRLAGRGVFFEELEVLLRRRGVQASFHGIDE
jgi:predicted secreted protein